jgi:tetratricopeptide (TPR) repeat protein
MKQLFLCFIFICIGGLIGFYINGHLSDQNKEKISLGLLYQGMQEYEKNNFGNALKNYYISGYFDSNNSVVHKEIGKIYYDKKLYDMALPELKKFINNPPKGELFGSRRNTEITIPFIYYYIADIYEKKDNESLSKKYFNKILKKYPKFEDYLKTYIRVLEEKCQKSPSDIEKIELYSKILYKINR